MTLKHFFLMLRQVDEVLRQCTVDFSAQQRDGNPLCRLRGRQIALLLTIARHEPCSLSEVMRLQGLSASAASTAVDKLVRSGLLGREINSANRRSVLITVKPVVHNFLAEFDRNAQAHLLELLKSCPLDELERMNKASESFIRHLEIGLMKDADMGRRSSTDVGGVQ
ncbi:MAG: MarR family winged helix-turn-helix transcriptional regulator [Lentisphaeria bacterium]|jgi:DNA-binding MarR family transcriptional regulator